MKAPSLLWFLGATVLATSASAYLGAPDPSFGSSGVRILDIAISPGPSQSPDIAHAVAIQADGRIVVAGETNMGFMQVPHAVIRMLSSGNLDAGFADQGKQYGYFADGVATSKAYGVAIQPDGRIVVAGSWSGVGSPTMGVARYTAAGVLEARVTTSINGPSGARAVRLQPDGKVVVAGLAYGGLGAFGLARYNADLSLDTSFNSTGKVVTSLVDGSAEALAMALHADGRIVAVGHARNMRDFAVVSYQANGAVESASITDLGDAYEVAAAVAIQVDGRIIVGGNSGTNSAVLRFTQPGVLDDTFGVAGKFLIPGSQVVALALQPDGKILALTLGFQIWRLTSSGVPDPTFGVGGRVVVPTPMYREARAMALQADGRIVVAGTVLNGTSNDFFVARVDPATSAEPTPSASSLDFGGQSMNTTSAPVTLQLSNGSASAVTVRIPGVTDDFAVTGGTCGGTLPALASCAVAITFMPRSPGPHAGTLSFDAFEVSLTGIGERSLVTHYYRSILRRAPDASGKAFWEGEAVRVAGIGASVNEVWFAMAQAFYSSAEYAAFNRNNTGFVTDLYNTFFNRAPDPGGLAFWVGQIDSGMPREVALAAFMFSTEFRSFAQAIFGDTTARAEVNAVVDFYRGLLARLPDDDGLSYWVGRFRLAQCKNASAVTSEVEAISSAFALSSEYATRSRMNAQYVGDLYNAFLRRGGDLQGVAFWIGQLETKAQSREQVRIQFKQSAEFQARANAIVQQGCLN